MGRAKNTLSAQDVSSTPIKVQYFSSYPSNSLQDYGITVRTGSNIEYNVTMSSAQMEDMNNYRVVKQLYYQYYLNGSLSNSASCWDPMWQSTAAALTMSAEPRILTASNDEMVQYFPTASDNSTIIVLTIPSNQFGEQIARGTFMISASDGSYRIVDDGNGNLIDAIQENWQSSYVGNIYYAQGIAVITNTDYTTPDDTYLATELLDIYETEDDIAVIIQ